ncbi:MAG: arabinosyltransferase domain-containing protein [Actinomycetota bacterium]|nr:arabinosyltransferase domain-containing protein [Actinomycetota bacterium]
MLSPSRSAPVVEPGAEPGAPPASARVSLRARRAALILGVIALLSALAFPFGPVNQPEVEINWPSAAGSGPATAIPLMPYQPISLMASLPCEVARGAANETVLLSTIPLNPDPQAPVLPGLRISVADGNLLVASYGRVIAEDPIPAAGACGWTLRSNPTRTVLDRDGKPIGVVYGDVRPGVAGIFTEADDSAGMHLRMLADTRFHTSITPGKLALAVLCLASLSSALAAIRTLDRIAAGHRRLRLVPARWWRPRLVDVTVAAVLGLWAMVGPISVDDGYIAGIIRSRSSNGFSGNVYRWFNAPEAPFSYFYELYALWATVSFSPLWMRIPSVLLGLLTWFMLSRLLLPRLGAFAAARSIPWVAAAMFVGWWLPFNLGLRPEPWVAAGLIAVACAVERAVATRRLLPLLVGLVLVGATVAVTPTGSIAVSPFLAALFPIVRIVRARTDVHGTPLVALVLAAPGSALLLMFADQTYASVAESIRVRSLVGGGQPWYQEYVRYASLLDPADLQGALQARVPVLLALAGIVGLSWRLHRRNTAGIAMGPARRVVLTVALSLALMTFTPTKWTMHFGALAGVGAALLVLAVRAWSGAGIRSLTGGEDRTLRVTAAGIAALTVVSSLALAGLHQYPYVSNYGITWSTLAPVLFGYPMSGIALAAGSLVVGGLVLWSAWRATGGSRQPQLPGWVPTPAVLALVLVLATVALQLGSFTRTSVERRNTYTVTGQNVDVLSGDSCGLADDLRVEPDPRAGLLALVEGTATPWGVEGFVRLAGAPADFLPEVGVPLALGGTQLPGWASTGSETPDEPISMTSGWFSLTDAQQSGELPLVMTLSGDFGPRDGVVVEFGAWNGTEVSPGTAIDLDAPPGAPEPGDIRMDPAAVASDADVVRLVVTDGGGPLEIPLSVSEPRAPQLIPMNDQLPPGTTALVDWPVAFLFPCITFAALPPGTAELPPWRIAPPSYDEASGGIAYAPQTGGPFVAPRLLVREERVPVYLHNDLLRDVAELKRWVPISELERPGVEVRSTVEPGWERLGRVTVPGLDPV